MTESINTKAIFNTPEFTLLLEAMHYKYEAPINDSFADSNIDWEYLLELAEMNGLIALLFLYIDSNTYVLPESVQAQLRDRYQANALRNRILTHELVNLLDIFNSNGIATLAYKGPALTLQAYEGLEQRQFGDLDILINKENVLKACALLKQQNYQRTIPDLSPTQENDFIRTDHEHEFISPDQLVHIDLHWSLSTHRFPFKYSTNGLYERAQSLQWGNSIINHIGVQDMLLFLCMHANKDLWRKLIWICDIDRLIRKHDDIDWDLLIQQAREGHCEKMLRLALLVTYDTLKTPVPERILKHIRTPELCELGEQALRMGLDNTTTIKVLSSAWQ